MASDEGDAEALVVILRGLRCPEVHTARQGDDPVMWTAVDCGTEVLDHRVWNVDALCDVGEHLRTWFDRVLAYHAQSVWPTLALAALRAAPPEVVAAALGWEAHNYGPPFGVLYEPPAADEETTP